MEFEKAAPCRHRGAPPEDLINQVVHLLKDVIAKDEVYLNSNGISIDEFERAFPAAIERIRGSAAASNKDRRDFAIKVIKHLAQKKKIKSYSAPQHGDDTVYRLQLNDGKQIGIVQKGCPDGAHSSTKWERPDWADELYLWWVCSSLSSEPGEHIWKGISRVRKKVAHDSNNQLDGVIFFNNLCGSFERPCPKEMVTVIEENLELPPPCIYVFPHWNSDETELNWRGNERRVFPAVMLSGFGIKKSDIKDYIGFVGFRISGSNVKTEITTRFGPAKATSTRG